MLPQETPVLEISKAKPLQTTEHHQWAVILDSVEPMNNFHEKVPVMAMEWDFELDTFQKKAIACLDSGESVFVAAHTSAGKTVIAEYAIALSRKHVSKAIYTSPIKALSNQKYRDFCMRFSDIGILTGDVKINPDASCLIMTTEILRSMLYNNSKSLKDLEWVIFDEVHYVNNVESLGWYRKIKKRKIFVINTLKRPVPLEHYLYIGQGGKHKPQQYLILDSSGRFLKSNYAQAKTVKAEKTAKFKQGYGGKQQMTRSLLKTHMTALIKGLEKDHKLPVVCFTLSRRRCDSNAELLSSLDLTTRMEKDEISDFFRRCTAPRLRGTDQNLAQVRSLFSLLEQKHTLIPLLTTVNNLSKNNPAVVVVVCQVVQLKDLLVRGVGVHHSGILPLLKEVVEMLFQRGLVKVVIILTYIVVQLLFATETFAMGVNMPTRTVIFENISKHDGRNYRTLLASEYIQMAGRAGRRGIDTTGTVIILGIADLPDLEELQKMMLGKATDLDSQFRLTYNMILNLLRSTNKKLSMEQMMRESFLEHSNQSDLSDSQKKLEGLKQQEREEGQLDCPRCMPKLEEFLVKFQQAIELRETFFSTFSPAHLKPYLRPGRIMILSTPYHPKVPALLLAANGLLLKLIVRRPKNSAEQEPYPRWTKLLYNPSEQESEFHYLPDFPVSKLAGISTKEIKSNMMGDILSICDQGLM
ncbi:SKIV2L [Cordylochernes scorpioides]|uniref:SKIV2L n=1 Tax=Cordylochernes scorpioides TaxID=51811 RepID=A0ABY6L1Z1_9ARAC|nr:SKIV2L [Cordylochernes scorpioides]